MTSVLLATDADWIADEVVAALADDDTTVSRVRAGAHVRAAVGESALMRILETEPESRLPERRMLLTPYSSE